MPMSCYQRINQFMACDEFGALINDIHNLIGFGMNSNLSLVSIGLVDGGMFQ